MKKRLLLVALALLLLVGCTPSAQNPSGTQAATVPPKPEVYPEPLEDSFYVCADKIDMLYYPGISSSHAATFYLMTKEEITAEDVTIKTGDISWIVTVSPRQREEDESFYRSYLTCKDIDWKRMYEMRTQEPDAWDQAYSKYFEEANSKKDGWFPGYYCYFVIMDLYNRDVPRPEFENGQTETELTITVKGETKVLKDVITIRFYNEISDLPNREGPMIIYQMSMSNDNTRPTDEGYFYSDNYTILLAREDLTITGISFLQCPTASFVKLQLIIDDVRVDWDGKTPVDVAAEELVQLRFVAKDPTLANQIVTSANRTPLLEYTSGGENYVQTVDCAYRLDLSFYECYAFANGNGKGLSSYYADYESKVNGWSYDGSGTGDNPFDNY